MNPSFSTALTAQDATQLRTRAITQARQRVLREGAMSAADLTAPWVERSWQRCLQLGFQPEQRAQFDVISPAQRAQTQQSSGVPIRLMQASMIRQAMEQASGNVSEAAQALGISRATLYRKLGHRDSGTG